MQARNPAASTSQSLICLVVWGNAWNTQSIWETPKKLPLGKLPSQVYGKVSEKDGYNIQWVYFAIFLPKKQKHLSLCSGVCIYSFIIVKYQAMGHIIIPSWKCNSKKKLFKTTKSRSTCNISPCKFTCVGSPDSNWTTVR